MYKYYRKKEYKVMEYEFDSITEVLEYIHSAPTSNAFKDERLSSMETEEYGDWYGTKNFEEAENLLKYGWYQSYDKIIELKFKLEKYIKLVNTNQKQYNYYVGYAPDVKAYLEGHPLTMFNKDSSERKHIDIYYNAANLAYVDKDQIFNRGAITLSLVEILENMGFSVGLNVFTMSNVDKEVHYFKLNLKRPDERLNPLKLFFPLCHPSFLRRIGFRLKEQTPDITENWIYSYGSTCKDLLVRKILDLKPNDIVICRPDEMNIEGVDIIDDANNMFDYVNRFTKDVLEIERLEDEETRKKHHI